MTSEEFWKDDPQLFVAYRTSFINKKKREMEEVDYKCWLQGLYNHNGNGLLFRSLKQFIGNMIAGMFKGHKDNTPIESYPKVPYGEQQKQQEVKEKEKNKNYEEFHNSLIYYGTLKQQYLAKLINKKKGE